MEVPRGLLRRQLLQEQLAVPIESLLALQLGLLACVLKFALQRLHLELELALDPVCLLGDRVVHFEAGVGDHVVAHLLERLVGRLLHDQQQLFIEARVEVLKLGLQVGAGHGLQAIRLLLLALGLYLLLHGEEHVFVAVDFVAELVHAALGLLHLQVKRLHVALDLLDPFNYLLFKYFLPVLDGGLDAFALDVGLPLARLLRERGGKLGASLARGAHGHLARGLGLQVSIRQEIAAIRCKEHGLADLLHIARSLHLDAVHARLAASTAVPVAAASVLLRGSDLLDDAVVGGLIGDGRLALPNEVFVVLGAAMQV